MTLPPHIKENDSVVLFDGVCKLCNAWSNFIISHDKDMKIKLCSVQSKEGKNILEHFGFSTEVYTTMLYVEGDKFYQKSNAFFRVMQVMGFPWMLVGVFRILPSFLRDWLYDRIALNRYSLFGKYNYCTLPIPDHEQRYISE